MLSYTVRRVLVMIPTLLVISFITFLIIKLPPGDFLTNQIAELQSQGDKAALERVEFMRKQYGLDKPLVEQYAVWIGIWPKDVGAEGRRTVWPSVATWAIDIRNSCSAASKCRNIAV